MEKVIETKRLFTRKFTYDDFADLSSLLKDIEVMYAWEHAFSDEEVKEWIDNNIKRYNESETGYFALIEKDTGKFIGQSGLHYSMIDNKKILEVGYIIMKKFWNQGYAYEAVNAFVDYAFDNMEENEIYALIRPENYRSSGLAEKVGFVRESSFIKHYRGKDMVHDIYILRKDNRQ
ncbi:GNAT family N-acetyltransferase [Sebaldella sp. S0638]|uniref:GNAT family N-acetyltransferase n=1 Tax=Sebaldella sp. S0638 TaxID=2957809 RepID=UPI00209E782B|nr:GNAT family N-acetyltransferase [Sebaldella sp. S0638]MCP1225865.1 GNAT family N-acetyltransferase [Sebaldella sp. S0638]